MVPCLSVCFGADDEVELKSLRVRFSVADAYEDVLFDSEENDKLLM